MIEFRGRLILLDIEGTVSPLAYVHEVMFPYAREHVAEFLTDHWEQPKTMSALEQMAVDAGHSTFIEWCPMEPGSGNASAWVVAQVHRLMVEDAKLTGLKQLQGLIWEQGFRTGALCATLFDDVAECLHSWHAKGRDLRIYSSGSVQAQQLFFQHTQAGDLSGLVSGWYDTRTGGKRDPSSYSAIVEDTGCAPEEVLFVSDVVEELDAARAVNVKTALAIRPGNRETEAMQHPRIQTLREIVLT